MASSKSMGEYNMRTTNENKFTGYDGVVATAHLANWGVIYLDDYGLPLDVEEVMYLLGEEAEKQREDHVLCL